MSYTMIGAKIPVDPLSSCYILYSATLCHSPTKLHAKFNRMYLNNEVSPRSEVHFKQIMVTLLVEKFQVPFRNQKTFPHSKDPNWLIPILIFINSVHTLTLYSFKFHFNVIFPYTYRFYLLLIHNLTVWLPYFTVASLLAS